MTFATAGVCPFFLSKITDGRDDTEDSHRTDDTCHPESGYSEVFHYLLRFIWSRNTLLRTFVDQIVDDPTNRKDRSD
jgi:hypothetical protein